MNVEELLHLAPGSALWAWSILVGASLGTYAWRGLGVLLSGRLQQHSPLFGWITCVTYAMVAALVVRIIVLPVGVLAQTPMAYRVVAAGTAVAIMMSKKNRLVPAIITGTLLMMILGWLDPISLL